MSAKAAEHVAATIRTAVLRGTFKHRARLPSARELAAELGVNKNTVSKAYGLLAQEGVIEVAPGRRATVAAEAQGRARGENFLGEQAARALLQVLREARLVGIPQERVVQLVFKEITAFYEARARRVQLVECNKIDAQHYARELAGLLGCAVDWRLIEDVKDGAHDATAIFAVPYYHLQDLSGRVPADRLAAIHIAPHPAMLLQVIEAAQAMQGRVGLICGNPSSVARFSSLFRSYTPHEIRIAHYRDTKRMTAVVAASRMLFATPEALGAVREHAGRKKVTDFTESIDATSLGALRGLLLETPPGGALARGPRRPAGRGAAS